MSVEKRRPPQVSAAARWPHEIKVTSKGNPIYRDWAVGIDRNRFKLYFCKILNSQGDQLS